MRSLVIDASVAVKWFMPEPHSINAISLLETGSELLAPDLIFAECGNVLWKKWLRQELEPTDIPAILGDLNRMNMRIVPTFVLSEEASDIAITYRRSFYDSIYLALAVTTDSIMITADEKLRNALQNTPLAERIAWVGEDFFVQ
jgi:predicted nucleic acid-binding protein